MCYGDVVFLPRCERDGCISALQHMGQGYPANLHARDILKNTF